MATKKATAAMVRRIQELEAELIESSAKVSQQDDEISHHLANTRAANAAEKAAVYSATRLRRKIQHARAVIGSLMEILDTSDHPEG